MFQRCKEGHDSTCREWFGGSAKPGDFCCWRYEIVTIPEEYSSKEIKELAETRLRTFSEAGLASAVGEVSRFCMNEWSKQYPDGVIPPDFTYTDKDTEITVKAHCDWATWIRASALGGLLGLLLVSY